MCVGCPSSLSCAMQLVPFPPPPSSPHPLIPPPSPLLQIHVLQEDWSDESVQLVTSCWVTDVNDISVDRALPLYCTIVSLHTPSHPHTCTSYPHSSTHAVTPSLHRSHPYSSTSHPHSSTHAITPSLLHTCHHTLTPRHTSSHPYSSTHACHTLIPHTHTSIS